MTITEMRLKMVSSGVTYCKHNLYLRGCSKSEVEEHLRECFEEGEDNVS